jgi:hypothetical protein
MYYRFKSFPAIERKLQLMINLSLWIQGNGFKFLVARTTCIYFCRLDVFPYPIHFTDNSPLPFARTVRFLGLVLDSRLIWEPHICQLHTKCQQSLNILHILTGTSWEVGRMTVFRLCCCLIHWRLNCGYFIYASASKRILCVLDRIHNSAIRLCTGAYRTSSGESVHRIKGTCTCHSQILVWSYAAKLSALK